jgi:hypothetical protein
MSDNVLPKAHSVIGYVTQPALAPSTGVVSVQFVAMARDPMQPDVERVHIMAALIIGFMASRSVCHKKAFYLLFGVALGSTA